jgi:flavin reductase (DIM6/NTAB) family NADH-FMN oxidoreductase RutF
MADYVSLDLETMPHHESYALLTSFVQPRPIAFVSTISLSGVLNLAPFSFFMAGGSNPPSLCYSPALSGKSLEKDSLRNVRETREFVVNTVHRAMAQGMNAASASLDPDESEWELTGFTAVPSDVVKPPRVGESFAQMECRLFEIVHHGTGPSSARYVIGEVVRLHARADLWVDGILDVARVEAIGRMGGKSYLDTGSLELFQLDRPR